MKYRAIDPDGHEFEYDQKPSIGMNLSEEETWLAVTGSTVNYVKFHKNFFIDFKTTLKEVT